MLKKFGSDLRRIRENKKITLRDVSAKTRIHVSHFDKMENGDFKFFDATYIRAILKQYAKAIGLDSSNILFNFDLAKSGKYNSGFLSDYLPQSGNQIKPSEKTDTPDILLSTEEKEYRDSMELPAEKKITGRIAENSSTVNSAEDVFAVPESEETDNYGITDIQEFRDGKKPEKRKFSTSKRVKIEGEKGDFNGDYYKKDGLRIPYSFLKSAGVVILVGLLVAGIYLLIDIVFMQKKDTKTELIRPNFDEIVKENEKKILGKKTEEEIRDSISKETAKLDSIKKAQNDSVSFSVKALGSGLITVILDSLIEENVLKERFKEGDSLIFKAKNTFWVTSKNTENIKAYLNGSKLVFDSQEIKAVKITRKGIQKKTLQSNGNQPRKENQ